ncbi:MAG: glycosyltransferase [Phycisphaerales bacterium]
MPGPPPSLLIALPQGLGVSGVNTWAVRLVNGLARRGRAAGLIVHAEPPGFARLDLEIDPRVGVHRVPADAPPIDACGGDLAPYLPRYRAAVRTMLERGGVRVVLSPNLHGDCYGVAAELTRDPEIGPALRVVGWQHSDIEYDARVLERYAPVLGAFVGVSKKIAGTLRTRLHDRAEDVRDVPYGVAVPAACPSRPPLAGRPVRLLYTGRLEHRQKRILALPMLSRELSRRGVAHELTILGDGPAEAALLGALRDTPSARRLAPTPPREVTRLLDAHDAFVLASRYEGLSVSMLEALARGCVPIVTRTESGALQAIEPGVNGLIADASPDSDEAAAGAALADAVDRFAAAERRHPGAMSLAAWSTARDYFFIDRHVDRVEALLDAVAASPVRAWPADRPAAFTGAATAGGTGSVPPDGPRRMGELLRRLAGHKVVIHGTGQHTLQLEQVIKDSPVEIVAFADDDRQKQGTELWGRPVIAPRDAAATGATDVVISSWMHEDAVWARRTAYEHAGLVAHKLYT